MSPSARVKHENIDNVGHLISGFSSAKAVRLLLLFWITICCVSILITVHFSHLQSIPAIFHMIYSIVQPAY